MVYEYLLVRCHDYYVVNMNNVITAKTIANKVALMITH